MKAVGVWDSQQQLLTLSRKLPSQSVSLNNQVFPASPTNSSTPLTPRILPLRLFQFGVKLATLFDFASGFLQRFKLLSEFGIWGLI
ncbi:unnamed protein product [Rhodiola kirilowii]